MLLALTLLVSLGQPVVWAEFDTAQLKGRPSRLVWSDDGQELCLQVVEGEIAGHLTFRHYLITQGNPPKPLDAAPAWLDPYWRWKSARTFFGDPLFAITIDTQKKLVDNLSGVSVDHAAYLREWITGDQLIRSKQTAGTTIINRLLLRNQVIGEFVDEQIMAGYTFSWSSEDRRLIAYRAMTGKLTIMNVEGEMQTVAGTANVVLPAWSEDGMAIAYLERTGRHTFAVVVLPLQ
jgi:hypothetical protein